MCACKDPGGSFALGRRGPLLMRASPGPSSFVLALASLAALAIGIATACKPSFAAHLSITGLVPVRHTLFIECHERPAQELVLKRARAQGLSCRNMKCPGAQRAQAGDMLSLRVDTASRGLQHNNVRTMRKRALCICKPFD